MKNLIIILIAIFLGACAHNPRHSVAYAPPSTMAVRTSVMAVQTATTKTVERVEAAREHIATAQTQAAEIAKTAPPDLLPKVVALRVELSKSQDELDGAKARANDVVLKLIEVDAKVDQLQTSLDKQTLQLVKSTDERNDALDAKDKMEVDRNIYRTLTWKWRIISLAIIAFFAAFFIARQYFPILKFI